MLGLLLPLALLAQDPAPSIGFEPLSYDGPELLEVTATTHPDPASAPEDAFLEVTGRIADYDPAVDIGVLCGREGPWDRSGWYREATIDEDGAFRLWIETEWWAGRPDASEPREVHLATIRAATRDAWWDVPFHARRLDVHTEPYLGTGGRWSVALDGDGPWHLDVGALELGPAPLVLEARVDTRGTEPIDDGASVFVNAGWEGNTMWRSVDLAIPDDGVLRVFSWSVRPGSRWSLGSLSLRVTGRQELESPGFLVPARVRAAVVPWLDLEFDALDDLGQRHDRYAYLVPEERAGEIAKWSASDPFSLWLNSNHIDPFEIGRPVHVSRAFAPLRAVAPGRYELVAFEPTTPNDYESPIRTTRLGPIDLTGFEAGTVRVAVDLELGDARVVDPAPARGPLTIDVVAELPGAAGGSRQRFLVTAHDPVAWRDRDRDGIEAEWARVDDDGRVRARLELREVAVSAPLVVRLFPMGDRTNVSLHVFDRAEPSPFGELRTRVKAVGDGAHLDVDLGVVVDRPAPPIATIAFETGAQPSDAPTAIRFSIRPETVRGAFPGGMRHRWMECETNRVVTLHSWLTAPLDPARVVTDVAGLGPTTTIRLPLDGAPHVGVELFPVYELRVTARDDTDEDLDGWGLVILPARDHFPVSGRAPWQDADDDRQLAAYDERREPIWLEPATTRTLALEPATVLELWRVDAWRTPGGQPSEVVEIATPTTRALELGPWRVALEPQPSSDAKGAPDEPRER